MTFRFFRAVTGKQPTMKHPNYLYLFLLMALLATACGNDDDDMMEPTPREAIENFVGDTLLMTLREFDFRFVEGTDRLDFAGTYAIDSMQLVATNIAGANFDLYYNPVTITLDQLMPETQTLNLESESFPGEPEATYYTASGNRFNTFARIAARVEGADIILLTAISATVMPDGLEDLQYTLIMLDDGGDPNQALIEVGQGRLFIDRDGLAERQ